MPEEVEDNYTLLMALGTWVLADACREFEANGERKAKKARVVQRKLALIKEAFPDALQDVKPTRFAVTEAIASRFAWNPTVAREYLIDLSFSDPFAPWQLKTSSKDFRRSIEQVAARVRVPFTFLDEVEQTRKAATRAHHHINFTKIALYGLGGAVILGAGGWMAAPFIGAALGGVAGLSGAAATGAGLAALGGGSLAAGGFGMAGGMAVITGISAAGGAAVVGGSQVLLQMGARGAREELIKLQTNYRAVLLHSQLEHAKAQRVVQGLAARVSETRKALAEERLLNDKNSSRIDELEQVLQALEDASTFVEESNEAVAAS